MGGIYSISNIINNKVYIGYTINFSKRKSEHFINLRNNLHKNQYLQAAFNKYGESNFKFEILEECDKEYLASQENYWCNLLTTHDRKFGYNIEPTSPIGRQTISKETKEKISKAKKGKVTWMKGRKHTMESLEKISMSLRGKPIKNLEQLIQINKTRQYKKGYCLSEEHKTKISNSIKGKNLGKMRSVESKERMRISKLGKKLTENHKFKIGFSQIGKKKNITVNGLRGKSLNGNSNLLQYDLQGNFIKEWLCSFDIKQEMENIHMSNVISCAKGIRNSAYGYKWKYKN